MSKLWVFSDSYGFLPASRFNEWKDKHWYRLLSDKLNCNEDFKSVAHNGCPNEWISYQIENCFKEINYDDYIIVVVTDKEREWFFVDNVGLGNIYQNNVNQHVNHQQGIALDYYKHFLTDNYQSELRFNWYLHYLNSKFNNYNIIILPGFENMSTLPIKYNLNFEVYGSLFDICKSEIIGNSDDSWHDWIFEKHKGIDPRVGHLSYQNHSILSEKLYDCFINKNNIDLNSGFYEEIL